MVHVVDKGLKHSEASVLNTSFTIRMQEKQTRKVIIYTTRSAYGDWKEDNGVRPICVYLTIMSYEE